LDFLNVFFKLFDNRWYTLHTRVVGQSRVKLFSPVYRVKQLLNFLIIEMPAFGLTDREYIVTYLLTGREMKLAIGAYK